MYNSYNYTHEYKWGKGQKGNLIAPKGIKFIQSREVGGEQTHADKGCIHTSDALSTLQPVEDNESKLTE